MSLAPTLGRWQYLRGKSLFFIEALRSWVTPGAAAGAFAKYLGVSSKWSILVAIALPTVIEIGGFLLGRYLYERGGVEAEYELAMLKDPYRRESLELFRAIRKDARLACVGLAALLRKASETKRPPRK